jgi:tetratricopeptide (TPR) repeat protein
MIRSPVILPFRAIAGGSVLAAGAFATGLSPSADGDVFWHLAAGRELFTQHALLTTDPFSSGAAGRDWVDVHWLFQLGAYAAHQWLGLAGLVVVKCLLVSFGATLLYLSLPKRRGSWERAALVPVLLAGLFAARSLLLVRPVIGTLVLLAFFFLQLERFGRDGRPRHLLWLVPAQIVWANFQGLSALGPALVGAYALATASFAWVGRTRFWLFAPEVNSVVAWPRARLLGAATLACGAALLVTPFGARGATLPATLLTRLLPGEQAVFARQVAENQSPFVLEGLTGGEMWHFKWALLALGLSVMLAGRRFRMSHALLLLGLGGLAVVSNRNVLLLYWLGAPILAINIGRVLRHGAVTALGKRGLLVAKALNVAVVLTLLVLVGFAASRETSLAAPAPFRVPNVSAEQLVGLPRDTGKVFAADHYGGYLIWRLYPRFKPYIDTRLVLRTADEYAEYLRLADEPDRFEAFQTRHGFDYVVLPVLFPDRYQRLIAHLHARPEWKLLYADGSEVLFGRRDLTANVPEVDLSTPAHLEQALAAIPHEWEQYTKVGDASKIGLATLYGAVGQFEQARRVLRGMNTSEAQALDARMLFAQGDLVAAERVAERLLHLEHDDVRSLNLLALIAFEKGNTPQGLGFLRTALDRHPFDPEANQLLTQLEESTR